MVDCSLHELTKELVFEVRSGGVREEGGLP